MDRELLAQRLAQADENAGLAFEVVAQQRQVVAALEAWGQDATAADRVDNEASEIPGRGIGSDRLRHERIQQGGNDVMRDQ